MCLDIESVEGRYLLSGSADGSIKLWDLECSETDAPASSTSNPSSRRSASSAPFRRSFPLLSHIERNTAHKHSVTSLAWYPLDTGLFISSSADRTVKVWDPNSMSEVIRWEFEGQVHSVAISQAGVNVAVGVQQPQIRLCDLRTSSSAHTLIGHTQAVLSVAWHPRDPNLLASGGRDKTIRLWDIRKAQACLAVLDRENKEAPIYAGSATAPVVSHTSAITALHFLKPSGTQLLSLSSDNRPRIWTVPATLSSFNSSSTSHTAAKPSATPFNFGPHIDLDSHPVQCSSTPLTDCNPPMIFIPNANDGEILAFDLTLAGPRLRTRLRAHLARCNALAMRPFTEELYSAGNDGALLCWSYLGDRVELEALEQEEEEKRRAKERMGVLYLEDGEEEERLVRVEEMYRDTWSDGE